MTDAELQEFGRQAVRDWGSPQRALEVYYFWTQIPADQIDNFAAANGWLDILDEVKATAV